MPPNDNDNDVPPPPYTETDIYSTTNGHNPRRPSHGSNGASSTDSIIYTPPHSNFGGDHDLQSVSSTAAYFASRPAPLSPPQPQIVHTVILPGDGTTDVPYPATLTGRDVKREDWLTFVNYLFPHRAVNEKGGDTKHDVEATVREWNDGFFGPRGVVVVVDRERRVEVEENRVPGAWDGAWNVGEQQQQQQQQRGGNWNGNGYRGFGPPWKFGGISVDGDRVSIGERFVADKNGVRMGSFSAGVDGISMDGRPLFGTQGLGGFRPGGPFARGGPGCGRGGWGGRGWGGPPGGWGGRGCGGDGEWRGRGRGRGGWGGRQRAASVDSVSSSASSRSESSVGSLPEYEDLREGQVPVARDLIKDWLSRPDEPITKQRVKEVKEQIKAAKHSPANQMGFIDGADKGALKREVKGLMKEWKQLKKQQRQLRKEMRKERRMKRREEKRERRETKREMKRAQRDWRRGGGFACPPVPPVSGVPPVPGVGVPPMPRGPPGMFGGWGRAGWFGGPPQGSPFAPGVPGIPGPSMVPGPNGNRTPGAWPGEEGIVEHGEAYKISSAKYDEAEAVEIQVATKEEELLKVHEAIALEAGRNRMGGEGKSTAEKDALKIEQEIEELGKTLDRLRTEADEAFARELAEEEQRGHRA